MRDELVEALEVAAADEAIELVELRGEGPNFCSGGDLSEFGTVSDTATAHWIRMQRNAGWWVDNLRQKTVVHVHGPCVGAGVELPAFAGTVVADAKATFALPEVTMGLIPGAGGTASIPRRIGRQRTAWMSLTGHTLTAQQARDWGLVDRISADAN
jgi:enoyl-CoA hydratase/carnithine racemase